MAKAQKLFSEVDAKLRSTDGVAAISNYSDVTVDRRTVLATDRSLDATVKTFLETAAVGAVSTPTFVGDVHSETKLLAKKMDVDEIKVNMLQVQGNKKVQDSILNLLNTGKPFAEVADNKVAGGQENYTMNLMQLGTDEKSTAAKTKLLAAGSDYFVLDSNEQGALIYKVLEKNAPKQMYEIAQVSYKVYASDETIDNLRAGLQSYISKNNTSKAFTDNAVAAGYQSLESMITSSSAQINRIESSRKGIQWAFGADKGSVSPIYEEGNDKMLAVALDEVIPEGYMPLTESNVRSAIEMLVRNDKKGEKLVAQYTGKASDIAGYAKVMNAQVDTAVVVTFSQDFIPAVRGVENELLAQAPYASQGKLSAPIKGSQGVFVYQVVKNEKSNTTMTPEQLAQRYAMNYGSAAVSQMALDILKENKDIENNLINFY